MAENYACDETFQFNQSDPAGGVATRTYTCTVDSVTWAEGDGFAIVELVGPESASPAVRVRFDRAGGNDVSVDIDVAKASARARNGGAARA
jgi:hypothetical protein